MHYFFFLEGTRTHIVEINICKFIQVTWEVLKIFIKELYTPNEQPFAYQQQTTPKKKFKN